MGLLWDPVMLVTMLMFDGVHEKTVKDSPVPLLSSLISSTADTPTRSLDWSRFRDDGITFLRT